MIVRVPLGYPFYFSWLVNDDILLGRAGNDLLDGGEGDDDLEGYTGSIRLIGGPGADFFYGVTPTKRPNILDLQDNDSLKSGYSRFAPLNLIGRSEVDANLIIKGFSYQSRVHWRDGDYQADASDYLARRANLYIENGVVIAARLDTGESAGPIEDL